MVMIREIISVTPMENTYGYRMKYKGTIMAATVPMKRDTAITVTLILSDRFMVQYRSSDI